MGSISRGVHLGPRERLDVQVIRLALRALVRDLDDDGAQRRVSLAAAHQVPKLRSSTRGDQGCASMGLMTRQNGASGSRRRGAVRTVTLGCSTAGERDAHAYRAVHCRRRGVNSTFCLCVDVYCTRCAEDHHAHWEQAGHTRAS